MMIRLDPPLPVKIDRGNGWTKAMAHFLLDYGIEHDLHWVCFEDDSGECWTVKNRYIRLRENVTEGRAAT